jgi:putative CocE/NonD family hydrolase
MNRFRPILFILFLILTMALLCVAQEKEEEKSEELSYKVSLAGIEDSGTFYLYVREDRLATIDFNWSKDGRFSNSFVLSLAGQKVEIKLEIYPDTEGVWNRIEQKSSAGDLLEKRIGRKVTRTFRGGTFTLTLEENSMLWDNSAPALVRAALKAYDLKEGGKQKVSIYMINGVVIDGSLEKMENEDRTMEGKDITYSKYHLDMHGVDIFVYVNKDGAIDLMDIPVQNSYFVRKGYEAIAKKEIEDPLLSRPEYEFNIQKNVMVPMRDKIKLATDIYLPKIENKAPLILIRTPYGKDVMELQGKYWARRGYAAAMQDCRGRFKSEGEWVPFMNEAEDGYDTIEWLAVQPWCSGKVGMIGGSYVGWVQWWAASQQPPHLVTIIPNVAPPDPHYNIPYEYGSFFVLGAIWWAYVLEAEATVDISGAMLLEISDQDYSKILNTLPVIDIDKVFIGKENKYWRSWIEHPDNGPFWERANIFNKLKGLKIPIFHQSGWYDGDGIGTKLNYLKVKEDGKSLQKMIVGPWGHTASAHRMIGDRDFGQDALLNLEREYIRWMDFWLKGVQNGIDKESLVSLFVMGSNKWLKGQTYPLELTDFKKMLLVSGGNANTNKGDGRLSWNISDTTADFDKYVYDPGDPTPDPSFYPTRSREERQKSVISQEEERKKERAYHKEVTGKRKDILVYSTEPLDEPLSICGPVSAVLYASSSAKDTDWFVTLWEEQEDGEMFPLVHGTLRARYRNSLYKPELLENGKVYRYELDLWHTGITIPKGRRLVVEVSSSMFPMFSRNLNTGGHNEKETKYVKAEQTIYHSEKYPSHILLPVISAKEIDKEKDKQK